jgi:hypothetical protein
MRLKEAGALDGPIMKGSVVDAALNAGMLGQGGNVTSRATNISTRS